jgi:hypothetical protein
VAEPFVYHFVLVKAGQPVARGERIATVSIPAETVARDGIAKVRRAVDAERATWARRAIAAGYVDGYGVSTVSERGYRRSIFPSAVVPALSLPGSARPVAPPSSAPRLVGVS